MPSKDKAKEAKPHGHFGNNGLKGKPSNNKGKKRTTKVPRKSKLDMEIERAKDLPEDPEEGLENPDEDGSDVEELLDHAPISAHMYRSAFIRAWCSKLRTNEINEDMAIKGILGHNPAVETNCVFHVGEEPSCATASHLRKNVKVKGQPYTLPPVKNETDRHIRPYHFWMYNSAKWPRVELALMSKSSEGQNASHVCGGSCLNHAKPETNQTNQSRKPHHAKMVAALEKGNVEQYRILRHDCNHEPKCFINPTARNMERIIQDTDQYKKALYGV